MPRLIHPLRYRVDIWLACGSYTEYTSRKGLDSLEMAEALGEHLKRNSTRFRIVELNKTSERIIKEWQPKD